MKLIEYLPNDYTKSGSTLELLEALEKMWRKAQEDTEDFEKQLFLSTATWGLDFWEQMYGIENDESKGYEVRRSVVRAKIRGAGTTIEQNAQHKFVVMMASIIGIPPNIEDLRNTIKEIKPAHLDFEIVFKYNIMKDLQRYTHGQLKASGYTHRELRTVALPEMK